MADAELTHLPRTAIDLALAEAQHAAYRAALAAAGADILDLPPLAAFPDSAFVEDLLLAFPELFVLCRPGAASRRGEADALASHIPADRPLMRFDAPATMDGGDVLAIGRTIFVGLSTRTNEAAAAQLARWLDPFGYAVQAVPVGGSLHLKTAVTALNPEMVVLNPSWIDPAAFTRFAHLDIHPDEPFAANTLRVGQTHFAPAAHPRTAARIHAAGIPVIPLDVSEFAKAEAGLTCLSVLIPPPGDRHRASHPG